jgi:antitoxin MazE
VKYFTDRIGGKAECVKGFIENEGIIDECINIVYIIRGELMEGVIKKWGNSLGIRIPNLIIRELSLKDGSFVEIKDRGNEIIVTPKQKNTLSAMLNKINDQNIHREIETGEPVGKELW